MKPDYKTGLLILSVLALLILISYLDKPDGNHYSFQSVFLEIVLQNENLTFGRDELEDALNEELGSGNAGTVTGAGSGPLTSNIDVEVYNLDEGLKIIRKVFSEFGVHQSTVINQYEPVKKIYKP